MKLSAYIESVGTIQFARDFNITRRAAESYYYESRRPKPDLARRIVARTPVTWAGIYPRARKSNGHE